MWCETVGCDARPSLKGLIGPSEEASRTLERVTGIEPAWPAWKGAFFEESFSFSAPNQVEVVPSDCLSAALMVAARAASRSCSACW
jgi:hypothetical protein